MTNLLNFIEGHIVDKYTEKTEVGFPTQGNIGAILNNSNKTLEDTKDGLLLNRLNKTSANNSLLINNIQSKNQTFYNTNKILSTPLKYCNTQDTSDILPNYPFSKESNKLLAPDCNLMIDGKPAPQLYGETTFGLNNVDILNNPVNHIGHEIQQNGISNKFGIRALSQANYACQDLVPGNGVPPLKNKNYEGTYSPIPTNYTDALPLYGVGNWQEDTPNNFYKDFKDSLRESGCVKPTPKPEPIPPIIPIVPVPICPSCPEPGPKPGPIPGPIPGPRPRSQRILNSDESDNTLPKNKSILKPKRPVE